MTDFAGTPYGVKVRWVDEGAQLVLAPLFIAETIEKSVASNATGRPVEAGPVK